MVADDRSTSEPVALVLKVEVVGLCAQAPPALLSSNPNNTKSCHSRAEGMGHVARNPKSNFFNMQQLKGGKRGNKTAFAEKSQNYLLSSRIKLVKVQPLKIMH